MGEPEGGLWLVIEESGLNSGGVTVLATAALAGGQGTAPQLPVSLRVCVCVCVCVFPCEDTMKDPRHHK